MNRDTLGRRSAPLILALGLVELAGCHHLERQPQDPLTAAARGDRTSFSPAQRAAAQIDLGRVLEQQGDTDRAILAYKEALTHDASRADAYLRLAVLHDQRAKFREAGEYYQKALDAKPGDAEIFCDKGYSLYLQHRLPESEMVLRQAVKLNPELSRAHVNLGLVHGHMKRPEQALAEFRKAGLSEGQARQNLGFILTMDGKWAEAHKQYDLALAADPESPTAQAGLQQLERLEANPALAKAAKSDPAVLQTALIFRESKTSAEPAAAASTKPAKSRAKTTAKKKAARARKTDDEPSEPPLANGARFGPVKFRDLP